MCPWFRNHITKSFVYKLPVLTFLENYVGGLLQSTVFLSFMSFSLSNILIRAHLFNKMQGYNLISPSFETGFYTFWPLNSLVAITYKYATLPYKWSIWPTWKEIYVGVFFVVNYCLSLLYVFQIEALLFKRIKKKIKIRVEIINV